MKAPQVGGLRALQRSSRRKTTAGRAEPTFLEPVTPFAARIGPLFVDYAGPLAAFAVLVVACFTLPIHRAALLPDHTAPNSGGHLQPADYDFHVANPLATSAKDQLGELNVTIPAVRRNSGPLALIFWFFVDAVLLTLASLYWLRCFRRGVEPKYKRFLLRLIFYIPAFVGLMSAAVIEGSNLGGQVVAATLGSAGVIASALLISTVIGRSASTLAVAVMAASMGLMNIFPAWATVTAVAGSIAGLYPARAVRDRRAVVRCAAFTMGGAAVSAFCAVLISGRDLDSAGSVAMQALLTGCLGAALWFTLLTMMEGPLELTTPLGLLELLDPTRPILERFAREAPGTFAHSLMVGHLAASAAESIGADQLLCRVAAQYHDLGKMCRAEFFKENQKAGDDNVHDRLAPSLSAIVVTSHVRDGERMAKELGLPPVIQDIITQHHGTSLMRYFYYRASAGAQQRVADSLQYQFRYPGPKPQTKEAGIMMMADAVEAALRTLECPTPDRVRELIDQIVDDRIEDHQLDECPLTLRDISLIRETLAEVACAMLHQRIQYPGAAMDARESAVFDFYEDFDPSILFPISGDGAHAAASTTTSVSDEEERGDTAEFVSETLPVPDLRNAGGLAASGEGG